MDRPLGGVDGHLPGAGPWLLHMRWTDLLFAHWRVAPEIARELVPPPLEPDLFDGSGWVGLVPFRMSEVHPRLLPSMPAVSAFPEVNVRTYARYGGRPGVWFLSLDASERVAVEVARRTTGLPYLRARMSVASGSDGWIGYASDRDDARASPGRLVCRYRPTAEPPAIAEAGSLAAFLVDRDGLWTLDGRGRPRWLGIRHGPWPLQAAELVLTHQTLTTAAGVALDRAPDHVVFSRDVEVVAWRPLSMR